MSFYGFLVFLLDPALRSYESAPHLQEYLQSTPFAPAIDVLTAILITFTLLFRGLPFQNALALMPHLINRRAENLRSSLSKNTRTARLRLAFSLCWTSTLIRAHARRSPWEHLGFTFAPTMDRITFMINILSTISFLVSALRWINNRKGLEEISMRYAILPTQQIDSIYRWSGNLAIWIHCFALVYPFNGLIFHIFPLEHYPSLLWRYVRWYIKAPVVLSLIFVLCAISTLVLLIIFDKLLPVHGSFQKIRKPGINIVGLFLFSFGFKGFMNMFLFQWFNLFIWNVSDALFWAVMEASAVRDKNKTTKDLENIVREIALELEKELRWEKEREQERKDAEAILEVALSVMSEDIK